MAKGQSPDPPRGRKSLTILVIATSKALPNHNRIMDERAEMCRGDGLGQANSALEARRKKLQNLNVQEALAALEDEFNAALKLGPKETSGLVEMQRWLAKLRPRINADEH